MSRGVRIIAFLVGAGCVGAMMVLAFLDMPHFGTSFHPYRDHAVSAAVAHRTPNVVSAVNFDQRAIDTLGEETIFFGSVIGAAALLRPAKEEREEQASGGGRTLEATRLVGYLLIPLTLVIGLDVVAHGAITPGGGFQGGVVLATGLHLLYVAGRFESLERLRPVEHFEYGEVVGALMFAGLGFAGIAIASSYLANVIPFGTFGQLLSAGTVAVFNFAVGIEVSCGVIVVLSHFLRQAIALRGGGPGDAEE